jgi:hypothetical protein
MYHELFACTVYDFYGLELCTMYDSYDVYLRVLWTICIYKFSRCHVVVFHGFFVPFIDFWHKPSGNRHAGFLKIGRFIGQTGQFISAPSFTVSSSSPVRFGRIFLIFAVFYRFFQKPMGSVTSDFCGSAEFLNTDSS